MTTINAGFRRTVVAISVMGACNAIPFGSVPSAFAQGAPQLDEIIVTAQRTESSLQTTPVAITALDTKRLQQLGVYSVNDVDGLAPNINLVKIDKSGGGMEAFIRGIGTVETALTADPRVGIYVDDIYVSKTWASVFDVTDIERVEVLRGPQGTLFGRNVTGGAILVSTKKPSGEFGVNVKGSVGNFGLRRSGVSVDLPAVGDIATKLSLYRMKMDGWGTNRYVGPPMPPANSVERKLASEDNWAWRAALRWTPSEELTIDYVFDQTNNEQLPMTTQAVAVKDSTYNGFTISPVPFTFLGGSLYQQMAAEASGSHRKDTRYLDSQTKAHLDVIAHSLTAAWTRGDTTIKYIFGYRDTDSGYKGTDSAGAYTGRDLFYADGDVTWIPDFAAGIHSDIRMTTHELQLMGSAFDDKVEYVAGVYFYREEVAQDQPQTFSMPIEFLLASAPALRPAYIAAGFCGPVENPGACIGTQRLPLPAADPNGNGLQDMSYGQRTRSRAGYVQGTYRLTSTLRLSAGVRYTKDTRKAYLFNESLGHVSFADRLVSDHSWDNWSGMVNVDYEIAPDKMLYAKYTTSFNSGMFNPRASIPSVFLTPVDLEKVAAIEVGLKSQWLDNRLRFNIAAFRNSYDDIQVAQFEAGTGGAVQRILNAGTGTYKGVEIDVTAIPMDGLTIDLTYGYLDAKYDKYKQRNPATDEIVDISGRVSVPFAPKNTASLSAKYSFPRTRVGVFSFSMTAQYKDEFEFDPIQTLYVDSQARTLLGARLALAEIPLVDGGDLEISLWGKNLTDKEYRNMGTDFGGLGYAVASFGTPRTYGLDIVYQMK